MASKSGGCNSSSRNNNNNNNNNNNMMNGGNSSNKGGGEKKQLDFWRDYFRRANSDIFEIIEHAIMVAASDCPKEFRVRKAGIAELLFSCRLTRCLGCDRVELAVSQDGQQHDDHGLNDHDDGVGKGCFDDHGGGGSKGSNKVVQSATRDDVVNGGMGGGVGGDDEDDDELDVEIDIEGGDYGEMGMVNSMVDPDSNLSFGDAEALTDEIEQERELINEVLRIKDVLHNSKDESESELYQSLRRLQLMHLTVNILKETEIGKAVNSIRKHSSQDIRHLARSLIDAWKVTVDEWVKSTQYLAEGGTPDSVNPSTVEEEEEGLPSPPMDEGAFFSTQAMDFNQFFDGMDDDGNPRNCGEFNKNRGPGRKPTTVKQEVPKQREEPPKEATPISKDNRAHQMRRQQPLPKPSRPSSTQSGPGRPWKPNVDPKVSKSPTVQQKPERPVVQRKPAPPPQPEKLRSSNDDSVQEKLEATKRKLQERYQQAENAKRQRTIQVMEIQDIPKQGLVNRNPNGKFGNRHWANGRR